MVDVGVGPIRLAIFNRKLAADIGQGAPMVDLQK